MCDNDKLPLDPNLDAFNSLWAEYSYRHEHVWNNLYKLLAAALVLSIAPYLQVTFPGELKWSLLVPPVMSIILLGFSWPRISRELEILSSIRKKYREWQKKLFKIDVAADEARKNFSDHVNFFYSTIWIVAVANLGVSFWWIRLMPETCIS